MIHQAEKVMKDNADKIPDDLKTEVNGKLETLKSAAKGSDSKALQRQMDEFNESLQKIGQQIYQQAGGPAEAPTQDGSPSPEGGQKPEGARKTEDDVVDADYREVN
jgi:Hsp70 protein.